MDKIKDKWLIEYEVMTNEFCFYKRRLCFDMKLKENVDVCVKPKNIKDTNITDTLSGYKKCDRETCPLRVKLKNGTQTINNK